MRNTDAHRFPHAVVVAGALAFAGPGLGFLLVPDSFTGAVDLEMLSTTAASDARAVLGGLEVGLAVLLLSALRSSGPRLALQLQLGALGGLLLGRVVSLVVEGVPGSFGCLLAGIEAVLFIVGMAALRMLRRASF